MPSMFLRITRARGREYLILVENYRDAGRHRQRILYNFGRRDRVDCRDVFTIVAKYPSYAFLRPPRK